jgi:hypothetical protein
VADCFFDVGVVANDCGGLATKFEGAALELFATDSADLATSCG